MGFFFFLELVVVVVFCLWVSLMMGLDLRRGGFCEFSDVFGVGFVILELLGCCVFLCM